MALIMCPDCQAQVSDAAPACPRCGRPIAMQPPRPAAPQQPVTIQQTSKQWKGMQLIAGLACCVGMVTTCSGSASDSGGAVIFGMVLLVGGFIAFIVARAGAWWSTG